MLSFMIISLFGGVAGLTAIGVFSTIDSMREANKGELPNLAPSTHIARPSRPLGAGETPGLICPSVSDEAHFTKLG